jgi:hypothetical protein
MVTETGEFKGNKTISLISPTDDKGKGFYPFTFGVNKAKLIIENFDDIKKFVEENSQ